MFGIRGTAGCCGIGGCGTYGICGMPPGGMPGICPAGCVAAGGAAGGARFEGTDIILVYSLGPCGGAAGGWPGVARNAWVTPPPAPYDAGGAGAGGAAGTGPGAPDTDPGPNMRVYSPDSCWGGSGAGGDPAWGDGTAGNWDAEGNCGPAGIPPGEGLKNCVNSLPCGVGVPASGNWSAACGDGGDWNMRVNSPGSRGLGDGAGQSPCAGTSGIDDWNIRVNSPGPAGGASGDRKSGV